MDAYRPMFLLENFCAGFDERSHQAHPGSFGPSLDGAFDAGCSLDGRNSLDSASFLGVS